ncbi:REST corepressor 1-like [Sycon ciliatum]|uniref:REST corepressor 1-like n=1 Tax=Sycon ciliatum TaxID=27933 RepID=UPI0031F6CDD3
MLYYTRPNSNTWSQSESGSEAEESLSCEPSSRVGEEYQAELPAFSGPAPEAGYREDINEVCCGGGPLWKPELCSLSEKTVEDYITKARTTYSYSADQALGMLHWHNFNVEAAFRDMANFVPFPDEMAATEDQLVFEEAFAMHGKCFRRIHEIMPEKDIGSLIRYYYNWKKGPSAVSTLERRARRARSSRVRYCELVESGTESDGSCISNTAGGRSPDRHAVRDQQSRTFGPPPPPPTRKQTRLPRGLHLDAATLMEVATTPRSNTHATEQLRSDVAEVRRHIQRSKEELRRQEGQLCLPPGGDGEEPRQQDIRKSNRWCEEEVAIALEALRTHGKDFNAMAALLEHKNVQQCRNFYMNHRRRLNLDRLIAEAGQPDMSYARPKSVEQQPPQHLPPLYTSDVTMDAGCTAAESLQ